MTQVPDNTEGVVALARAALARHEWGKAFDLLTTADARGELGADGLAVLADATWWNGKMPLAIETRERAYAAAIKAGDYETAATCAIEVAQNDLLRMDPRMAAGWLKRAEQILDGVPEGAGHGWLAAMKAFHAHIVGNTNELLTQAGKAHEIGARLGIADLTAYALSMQASALIAQGEVEAGMALADEATVTALSGELEPVIAGGVCCATIEACAGVGDFKRAADWTEAQDRWCRREGINGFPGMCRLFRSEIKGLHGAWPEAEAEARLASEELKGFIPVAAGLALYQIGELRLRRGDLPAAEDALLGAHAANADTQPALSLLRLAQGRADAAAASIEVALSEPGRTPSWKVPPDSQLYRLRLLPAQVEIALARGDLTLARQAADELTLLAERFATAPARAGAAFAIGSVELAEGDATSAARDLRRAIAGWSELEAPYEVARARMTLAQAYAATGAFDECKIELRTAHDAFERLGAALDLRRATELRTELAGGAASTALGTEAVRTERAFMFTDIVDSTRLAEAMGDDAWDTVIRSHDQVMRAAAAEFHGEEVKATGDGFFFAFADADDAIQAAIGMQRGLAEQRDAQAFAPQVRIGVHQAQANRVGLDYAGTGVNQAARIGSAGDAGEILVSATSLAGTRQPLAERERRTETLKGLSDPVELVSVDWQ